MQSTHPAPDSTSEAPTTARERRIDQQWAIARAQRLITAPSSSAPPTSSPAAPPPPTGRRRVRLIPPPPPVHWSVRGGKFAPRFIEVCDRAPDPAELERGRASRLTQHEFAAERGDR